IVVSPLALSAPPLLVQRERSFSLLGSAALSLQRPHCLFSERRSPHECRRMCRHTRLRECQSWFGIGSETFRLHTVRTSKRRQRSRRWCARCPSLSALP